MTSKDKLQKKPSAVTGDYTFNDVVDKACEELMNRQIRYSIRRIHEMEERICNLERELDDFLFSENKEQ